MQKQKGWQTSTFRVRRVSDFKCRVDLNENKVRGVEVENVGTKKAFEVQVLAGPSTRTLDQCTQPERELGTDRENRDPGCQ